MQDLQLIGVHEDGEHLLLHGADDERFQMPIDDALRAAIRRDRPRLGQQQIENDGGLRPRDVQALIRAGASAEEAASRAGWTVEKVHRYEGPILAEREHVAGLAQRARLRSPTSVSSGGSAPTLSVRVAERLKSRDVEVTDASWDSWRNEGGPWTVVLTFAAGGRQRQASWSFDLADRTVCAVDDEARWLSEEVQEAKGPIPAPKLRPASGRDATVYDVEAEGGMRPTTRDEQQDDPLDLMSAMRKRSTARGRRKPGGRTASGGPPKAATSMPDPQRPAPERALPLEDLSYDPQPSNLARSDSDLKQEDPARNDREHSDTEHSDTERRETERRETERGNMSDPKHDDAGHGDPANSEAMTSPAADARSDWPESEPAATLIEIAHEGVDDESAPLGTSTHDSSPQETSATDDMVHEPTESSARQSQSKVRPKRPVRNSGRKTGRPSVPAWDEIMFGSRPGVDRSSS